MKSMSLNIKGPVTRTVTSFSPSLGRKETVYFETGRRYKDIVMAPSRNIQGNFVSPNPWSYEVVHETKPVGTNIHTSYYSGNTGTISVSEGCIVFNDVSPWFSGISSTFSSNLYNSALSDLNERTRSVIDLSVSLAEAGATYRMLKVFKSADNYLFKSRNWRNIVRNVGQARLEFAYGWAPLASDLYGALDQSVQIVINEIESFTGKAQNIVPSGVGSYSFAGYGSVSAPIIRKGIEICKFNVKLKTSGNDLAKWTSLNPVSIAWELVPYSFVVDWFLDVGNYLRNLETSLLYANSFVSGYMSRGIFFNATWSCNATRTVDRSPINTYTVNASASYKYRKFSRTILTSYPAPRMPRFEANLGSGRLLNTAALLAQLIGRK